MIRRGRFHHLVHLAVIAATALMIALPLLLGPAMPAVVRVLADVTAEHHCKCGMTPGLCGCPECERAEQQLREDSHSPVALLRSSCEDPTYVRAPLPPMTLAPPILGLPVPTARQEIVLVEEPSPSTVLLEPPKPPPRQIAA